MKLVARLGGREARVEIERVEDGFEIQVDERRYRVDAASVSGGLSLLVDGAQHEVWVGPDPARPGRGALSVHLRGRRVDLEMLEPLEHLAREAGGAGGGRAASAVSAYMPGRVVALLVEEGDTVEPGQGVLVLEAMKMENEIQAESAGVISKIHVETGQAVETGDPLFDVE